ncbi:MAG: amidohydrolase family protein [Bacillota bacterium]
MGKIIDMHVHPNTEEYWRSGGKYLERAASYFGLKVKVQTIEEMAEEFRALNIMGVLLAWDAETNTGLPPVSNDYIANAVQRFPDTFIGFASVDPWKGQRALAELDRAINELHLRGVKFHQSAQAFYPNDRRFYPLWEKCTELKVPVLFHMGMSGLGAGVPGGSGILLDYTCPIYIDHVAADFPGLTIIGAHPAWPWENEMLAVALTKSNVYMDLSGWSPKYLSPTIVQYANTLLKDRFVFGSDAPFIKPQKWLADFEKVAFKEEVRNLILYENARKILNII